MNYNEHREPNENMLVRLIIGHLIIELPFIFIGSIDKNYTIV